MNKIQKSTSFILPILNLNYSELIENGLEGTYLGDYNYVGTNEWGDYLFLKFDINKLKMTKLKELVNHKYYVDEYDPEKDFITYIFKIPMDIKISVVLPFIRGNYSQINKSYVAKYFPEHTWVGNKRIKSTNRMILDKSEYLRKYWLDLLGQPLPEGAEVWSKPEKEYEVYNFNKDEREVKPTQD